MLGHFRLFGMNELTRYSYKKWVCTRVFCRRAFYAPRDQKQIWCFYCGKMFKT
jgi:hypothetical protein